MQTDGVTFSRPQANVRTRRDGVLERVTAIIDVLSAGDTFASLGGGDRGHRNPPFDDVSTADAVGGTGMNCDVK